MYGMFCLCNSGSFHFIVILAVIGKLSFSLRTKLVRRCNINAAIVAKSYWAIDQNLDIFASKSPPPVFPVAMLLQEIVKAVHKPSGHGKLQHLHRGEWLGKQKRAKTVRRLYLCLFQWLSSNLLAKIVSLLCA